MKLEEKNGGRHLTTNHLHNLKGKQDYTNAND